MYDRPTYEIVIMTIASECNIFNSLSANIEYPESHVIHPRIKTYFCEKWQEMARAAPECSLEQLSFSTIWQH